MKSNWNVIYTVGLLLGLVLTACDVGKDYVRPEIETPQTYSNDFPKDSSITNLNWWELFKDPVLVELIDSALVNNKNMMAAISRIEQSLVLMDISQADLSPSINYGVAGSSTYNSVSSDTSNSIVPVLNVSYTFDLWGKIKSLNEIALQNYLGTAYAQRGLQISIISTLAQSYIALRDVDNRLIISKKTAANFEANLNVMQARFNAGFISEVDLAQAKIQLSEAKTAIVVFNRIRGQIQNAIAVLSGRSELDIAEGLDLYHQIEIGTVPAGIPSELLNRRPDVLIAEQQLHAQTLQIGVAEALKYPNLSLSADLGAELVNPSFLFASLGVQILGPLFNANKLQNNVTLEELRTEELLHLYENTFITALNEVKNAMIEVKTYEQEYELRFEQMELASSASELSWVRYDGGLTSYLEVLNLQSSQFSAELKASEAYTQRLSSVIKLYEALGGGWDLDSIPVNENTTN